jgi:hypothetical protein
MLMGNSNGQASLDEAIEGLIAAQRSLPDVWAHLEPVEGIPVETPSRTAQVNRWFVHLPWRLFTVVAPLPGKALAVYELAWREGMMHFSAVVTITSTSLRLCGLTRSEKAQALACLEDVGLITVTRQRGKNPQVTILDLVGRFGRKTTTGGRGPS